MQLAFIINSTSDGWTFSLNDDGSDPSEPFPTYADAQDAAVDALEAALTDLVSTELFGE